MKKQIIFGFALLILLIGSLVIADKLITPAPVTIDLPKVDLDIANKYGVNNISIDYYKQDGKLVVNMYKSNVVNSQLYLPLSYENITCRKFRGKPDCSKFTVRTINYTDAQLKQMVDNATADFMKYNIITHYKKIESNVTIIKNVSLITTGATAIVGGVE